MVATVIRLMLLQQTMFAICKCDMRVLPKELQHMGLNSHFIIFFYIKSNIKTDISKWLIT